MKTYPPQQNHAIFLTLPFQGHINPSIQLALKLASRGFIITFLVFETTHQGLTQARIGSNPEATDIFAAVRTGPDPLDIRYRVMSDGLPLDFDRVGRMDEYMEWTLFGGMYGKFEEEIKEVILESKACPNVLVGDSFCPWASKLAKKCGLKYASFMTEPALVLQLYYHIYLLREHGHFDCHDPRKDPIEYIPGVKSIHPQDLPSCLQDKADTSWSMNKLVYVAFEDIKSADYVLCNTIEEIELHTILSIQTLMGFYAIGPINIISTQRIEPTSLWSESSCTKWLDSKPNGSILYVSFGSLVNMAKRDLMEIAYGLMLSNVGFVWVLRPRTTLDESDEVLPPGFENEVHGRGIVVPWTNQFNVLSHPAIGGFLTHCGWNSVLESIWCGIPMLCFPLMFDQPANRKLVVDDWKAGINLCDVTPIRREHIAQNIKNFMSPKVREMVYKNVEEVQKIFKNAFDDSGSSKKNLDMFIDNFKN